jgi:putative DNA methylase
VTVYRRKLIEVALPLEAINVASAREKSIRHGHPSTLHLWWSRKPLAACRAVLFASLVDDPSSDPDRFPTPKAVEDERTRLFGIIERLVLWENTTNEVVLEEARAEIRRSTGGNPPPVLDPFCGGGSIPLEAQRLGLTAYASDLNPVAVLITKALIEIPPKFANQPPVHPDARRGIGATGAWKGAAGLAEDVRRYGAWMRDEAERRIGHLYPKVALSKEQGGGEATVIAWIWARTVTCPNPACGARMPLVRSFALSTKKGKEAWVEPIVDRVARTVRFEVRTGWHSGRNDTSIKSGTGVTNDKGKNLQATFRCLVCETGIARGDYVDAEANVHRMGEQLLAVVAEGPRGRVYVAPSDDQLEPTAAARTMIQRPEIVAKLPAEPARGTFASNAQGRIYGFRQFKDYFTPRQLVALVSYCDLIGEARDRIIRDAGAADPAWRRPSDADHSGAAAYADAVVTYLALALDRLSDLCSSMATWIADLGAVRNTFARQGIAMSWGYAECNPITDKWTGAVGWVTRVLADLPTSVPATARHLDATQAANLVSEPAISTDPPYYSNIAYADLSDFFYVWLRRTLGDVYPDLFGTVLTPKDAELIASPYRFGGDRAKADAHFEHGLGSAFARIRSAATRDVPVTIFYAFKQAESDSDDGEGSSALVSTGWETMLEGLLGSGYSIDGTWPMRTERMARTISIGTNALASSIVLVCRPRQVDAGITTRKDFVASLKREMPEALRTLQHGNIAPVDLAQASIGPGMAIFSRYAKVLEPDGSAMRVRTALALINQVLDELLTEQEGEFDADTRWAIAWYEQFGVGESAYGTAETLSKAKNSSVAGLVEAGIVAASRGRVRLLERAEYSANWDPAKDARVPVWEATQRLVHVLLTDGEAPAGDLLARLGGLGDTARDLAYRMYHVAERKGWPDEARAYNALVVAWTDLARGAESARAAQPSQTSLGLE